MKKLLFLLTLSAVLFSCNILKVPSYSPEAVQMVLTGSNATDLFYTNVIASTDKSYEAHQQDYAIINSQINDILVLDSSRKNSTTILINANDLKNRFAVYEAEHKEAGTLNDRELKAHKSGMHALWSSLYNSEKNYNRQE